MSSLMDQACEQMCENKHQKTHILHNCVQHTLVEPLDAHPGRSLDMPGWYVHGSLQLASLVSIVCYHLNTVVELHPVDSKEPRGRC